MSKIANVPRDQSGTSENFLKEPSWVRSAQSVPQPLPVTYFDDDGVVMIEAGALLGWKAPLWSKRDHHIHLLRPEGCWCFKIPPERSLIKVFEQGADGWSSRRGIHIHLHAPEGVWFDQYGSPVFLSELDQSISPITDDFLSDLHIHATGAFCKWELSDENKAIAWLDDSFEHGPFTLRLRGPWLIISNGQKKIAYWIGSTHWARPMVKKGLIQLLIGRGGGWETEALFDPLVFD